MSKTLDEFLVWFQELSPMQRAEIVRFFRGSRKMADFGYYVGLAPSQQLNLSSNVCPKCKRPF